MTTGFAVPMFQDINRQPAELRLISTWLSGQYARQTVASETVWNHLKHHELRRHNRASFWNQIMWSVQTRTIAIACILVAAVMLTKPAVGQPSLPSIALKPPIPIEQNPHVLRFRERDTDGDGILNETEYIIGAGRERKAVQREFKVFDADGDSRLNLNEFLTVPIGQPENQRGVIDDPVIQLAEKRLAELMMSWGKWDTNGDGSLNNNEFQSARMGRLVLGR